MMEAWSVCIRRVYDAMSYCSWMEVPQPVKRSSVLLLFFVDDLGFAMRQPQRLDG